MDRKHLLTERQNRHKQCTKSVKDFLNSFVDEHSFVESNEFFAGGEASVVCGQATIGGKLVSIVAQNSAAFQGGMDKQQAGLFLTAILNAVEDALPVVFVLDSCGGKIQDGVELLNAYAKLFDAHGRVPSICIVKGNALGSMAVFATYCDFVYMTEDSVMAINSPTVLAAREEPNGNINEMFGAKNSRCTFAVKKEELGEHLAKLLDVLYGDSEEPDEADLNKLLTKIEKTDDVKARIDQLCDKGTFIEMFGNYAKGVVTGFAKIGGFPVTIIANNKAVSQGKLCPDCIGKILKAVRLNELFGLTIVTLVDCNGVKESVEIERSSMLDEIGYLVGSLGCGNQIALITGEAVGLGYTLLASKALGYKAVIAWDSAIVAPVNRSIGGLAVYNDEIASAKDPVAARDDAMEKYALVDSDPYLAAEAGLVDNVIDAKYSRIYLIAKLQATNND